VVLDVRFPIDTTADIESPEQVRFQYHLAGPARRALAYLLDFLVRGIVVFIISFLAAAAGIAAGMELAAASQGLILLVLFVVEWGYYLFFELLFSGRSPGKMALRLRVVTATGQPLTIVDSFLRNLLRAADFLPAFYALGVVVMARDRRFRRLGDLVAGTMVIVEQRHAVAGPLHIMPPPTQQELAVLPERLPLSVDDLDAIELFLRRAGNLSPAREHELAAIVAPIYADRLGLRVHDPRRFLQVLYHRARGERAAVHR
jgi:uncharacterized RDD family membrane protein YckC